MCIYGSTIFCLFFFVDDDVPIVSIENPSHVSGPQVISQISCQFSSVLKDVYCLNVPQDYLELCVQAMLHLKQCDRSNILYSLAKGLGTLKPDGSDSKFPAKRMPAGLLQHMVEFFAAENQSQVLWFINSRVLLFQNIRHFLLHRFHPVPMTIASG